MSFFNFEQEVEQKDQLQAQQQAAAATKNLIGSTKQSESTTSGEITESDKTSRSLKLTTIILWYTGSMINTF